MRSYLRFFLGTPQRFLGTLAGIGALLVFVTLFPGVLGQAFHQLTLELGPLLMWVIQLGVVIAVLALMLGAVFKK